MRRGRREPKTESDGKVRGSPAEGDPRARNRQGVFEDCQ